MAFPVYNLQAKKILYIAGIARLNTRKGAGRLVLFLLYKTPFSHNPFKEQ